MSRRRKSRWLPCPQCDEGKRSDGAQCGNCHGTQRVNVAGYRSFIHAARSKVHGWEPEDDARSKPVNANPGTRDKVAELAKRVEAGLPLWNEEDGLNADLS